MTTGETEGFFLGVDTSCYTTSVGVVDASGEEVLDLRRILRVKPGERGLRQSEALFQHLQNLPDLMVEAARRPFKAVAFTDRPRRQEGSYLPVFKAGAGFGKAMALCAGIPYYNYSHQEGHIRAALIGTDMPSASFLGLHLSGGTTEILLVKEENRGYSVELLGGTSDLHAGQMIDRIGVALGLPFPSGPHLEKLALTGGQGFSLPVSVAGLSLSLSGPVSAAFRALEKGIDPATLALAAQDCLARSILALLRTAVERTGVTKALLFGGVAANGYLRAKLGSAYPEIDLFFGRPELSTDNAVGLALLARESWKENK